MGSEKKQLDSIQEIEKYIGVTAVLTDETIWV